MKFKYQMLSGLTSLVVVGCAGEPTTKPAAQDSAPATTSSSPQPTQAEPKVQPPVNTKTQPATLKSGNFVSGEHPTQGGVRIVNRDGATVLELDQEFKTSDMGPDLVVILHRSGDVLGSTQPPAYALKKGDYLLLAPLQKFTGAQQYSIPATVNLSEYQSAAIWCRRFNATFGAAKLSHP